MAVDPNLFPDIGNVIRNRAAFDANQRQNALQPGRLKQQQQQTEINAFNIGQGERTEKRQIAGDDIMDRIQAGDANAFKELATVDPDRATGALDALAAERKVKREQVDLALLAAGRMAVAGMQSPPDWPRLRESTLKQHPTLTPEDIPERPSASFMRSAIAMMSGVAELQKAAGVGQGNVLTSSGVEGQPGARQNRLVSRGTGETVAKIGPPLTPAPRAASSGAGAGSGDGKVPNAVSNTILRAVIVLFGDIIDPESREIKVLDPEKRAQVANVSARAEEIFARGGVEGALVAVRQAAAEANIDFREFGVTVRDQRSPTGKSVSKPKDTGNAADPLRIRDFLNR
jgi:hypothetical protein